MKNTTFRYVIAVAWLIVLGICTCTFSIDALLFHHTIAFHWNEHPHVSDLLIISDAHVTDPYWLFIKAGHFTGFAILDAILFLLVQNRLQSALLALGYAVVTEIMQLFFYRDGRLLDMGIDAAGVVLALCLSKKWHSKRVIAWRIQGK